MAKKKKRKSLLPKRIAGVKVPKAVRKGRLGDLLASPTGRALLAELLLAAGAIGGVKKAADSMADKAGGIGARSFASGLAQRLNDGQSGGGQLALALGEAARAFVSALNAPAPQPATAGPAVEWDDETAEAPRSKKKPQPSTPPIV